MKPIPTFRFFSIPTGRNISDPRLFLWTGIFYGLILFLPFTLIFVGESSHATAIYTNIVLSIDCIEPNSIASLTVVKDEK